MRRTATVVRLPLIRRGTRIRCRAEPGFHPSERGAIADIAADMTDEELKIAASTPGGQLKAAGILERGPLKRAPRRQVLHDSVQPGVGFGLQAAVPGRSDKVVNLVIARAAQRPHQGFCLV